MAYLAILLLGMQFSACIQTASKIALNAEGGVSIRTWKGVVEFTPDFVIFYVEKDPKPAMRPAGIENVQYNVVTWEGDVQQENRLRQTERQQQQMGDGFDDRILEGEVKERTADLFAVGERIIPVLEHMEKQGSKAIYYFQRTKYGQLKAWLEIESEWPILHFEFSAAKPGYYSIGYLGAPSYAMAEVSEIWQPFIWQEKRFPPQSFMTLAYRCPLPTTLVTHNEVTYGVIAHPDEFPFDPLPLMENSRFGIAVRNAEGAAQPMLFAPVLGGTGSGMEPGDSFSFKMVLWTEQSSVTQAYEHISEELYDFRDYRHNDITTLNYISARSKSSLWIAFTNQSNKEVISEIELNHEVLPLSPDQELNVEVWINNQPSGTAKLHNNKLRIKVLPGGITAIKIKGMQSDALFQQMLLAEVKPWEKDFATLEFGKARAMIIQSGNYETHTYVYLQEDDTVFRSVSLEYTNPQGETVVYSDVHFPFEFTILLPEGAASFFFRLYGETVDGKTQTSELVKLYKNEKI